MTSKIIASSKNWIESKAIEQLNQTAMLPGMSRSVGMPDLHPGKDTPIGAVFACQGVIYPHLVGNDIGCGMGFWKTKLHKSQCKLDSWTKKLAAIESRPDTSSKNNQDLVEAGLSPSIFDHSLGTIGGGNHFAKLQKIESIFDAYSFEAMGLNKDAIYLLVHSGSRGQTDYCHKIHECHCHSRSTHNGCLPQLCCSARTS